jgi:hypothetical protein
MLGGDGCVEGDGVAERFELADELAVFRCRSMWLV